MSDTEFDPAHDKTYNKTCVTSKNSGQPVHIPIIARVLIYPSLDHPVEGSWDQRRLYQTAQKHRLIWVFAGRTSLIVGAVMRWLIQSWLQRSKVCPARHMRYVSELGSSLAYAI